MLHIIPSGKQVRALAELAIQQLGNDIISDDMPNEDELDDAVLAIADDRPHSRACGLTLHAHGPLCAVDCPTCRT